MGAVGDRGGVLQEGKAALLASNGADGGAGITPNANLRGDRGKEQLLIGNAPKVPFEEGAPAGVAGDTGDLDMVHRQDHGARATRLTDYGARLGQVTHGGTHAAQLRRDEGREEPSLPGRGNGFRGEPPLAVNGLGKRGGDLPGDGTGAVEEVGAGGHTLRGGDGHVTPLREMS